MEQHKYNQMKGDKIPIKEEAQSSLTWKPPKPPADKGPQENLLIILSQLWKIHCFL